MMPINMQIRNPSEEIWTIISYVLLNIPMFNSQAVHKN